MRKRWSPLWRPFERPLSASAQGHAVTILKNLYGFLVDQNYLMSNLWAAVGVPRTVGPKVNAGSSCSLAQWAFIEQQLAQLADTSANECLKFGLHLPYATGLRLSEVVADTVEDLQWVAYPADASDDQSMEGWLLRVIGKGQKEREVPLPSDLTGELAKYLVSRGLNADPEEFGNQGAHLLGKASDAAERAPGLALRQPFDPLQGSTATTFYNQIKSFFEDCAGVLRGHGDPKGRLHVSTKTVDAALPCQPRHASGMPIEITQQNLGHTSLATTTVYVTTGRRWRMKAVEAS